MIQLTTLKGDEIILNSDLIMQIEKIGDTMITFSGGNKVRVQEEPQEIVKKILMWQQQRWIPMVHE